MSEAILQILLILAYLAIGLLSVTFPIYAICVTFLKQEKWEAKKEREKKVENLKRNIANLTHELEGKSKDSERFKEIEKQIKNYKKELKRIKARFIHLTALGAVVLPVILLSIALIDACIAIYFFYEEVEHWLAFFTIGSIVLSGGALWSLYKTISAVEHATLRPARTVEFNVSYEGGETTQEVRFGKEEILAISVGTVEADLENVEVSIFFPPEIEIKSLLTKNIHLEWQPEGFDFSGYNAIITKPNFVFSGTYKSVKISVVGTKIGKYEVPVKVCAKGIYEYHGGLILNVA